MKMKVRHQRKGTYMTPSLSTADARSHDMSGAQGVPHGAPCADSQVWSERRQRSVQYADDQRTPYEVDYARVIHSASFRRLQGKTQILTSNDGDFHRTRMTHSLEVAQVALGILQQLQAKDTRSEVQAILPDRALLETICLVHDLGHPPFGHGGEVALNYCMRNNGGFEGNGQTLRILSKLEIFSEGHGSNLTRRTLLGALKYPVAYSAAQPVPAKDGVVSPINGQLMLSHKLHNPPKCYMDTEQDVVDWIYAPFSESDRSRIYAEKAKSLDCTIMDLGDDIAYGIHDLEDAISLGLVSAEQMDEDIEPSLWSDFLDRLQERYPLEYQPIFGSRYSALTRSLFSGDPAATKKVISRLVSYMLSNTKIVYRPQFESDMFRLCATLEPHAMRLLTALKRFILQRVIRAPQVQQIRFKGQNMIIQLFAYLDHDPRHLLPVHVYHEYQQAEDEDNQRRVICDYVASMTDDSLTQAYERLISPRAGSTFDNL